MSEHTLTSPVGLSDQEVHRRQQQGQHNHYNQSYTRTVPKIIKDNLLTLFNAINLAIAAAIMTTGVWNNLFFLGPVLANVIIGTYQEIKAKKTIDHLSLVHQQHLTVWRNHQAHTLAQDQLVLDDVITIKRGNVMPADGVVLTSHGLEVDESPLTGESRNIEKPAGTSVLSGSLVVSGQADLQLTAVGEHSFLARLAHEAKQEVHKTSELMRILNRIIQVLTWIIIPLGGALFLSLWWRQHGYVAAVLGSATAIIGMIPQGLVLLTSVALGVSAIKLSRQHVLVKSLHGIESLARVTTLCLDKTGTITTGQLQVVDSFNAQGQSDATILQRAQELVQATGDDNATARAILATASASPISAAAVLPFSSARKFSAYVPEYETTTCFAIGAPAFLLPTLEPLPTALTAQVRAGKRVLALVKSSYQQNWQLDQPQLLGWLTLVDELRPQAQATFTYLARQQLTFKVISGDDPQTVTQVARQAGLPHAEAALDLTHIPEDADWENLVQHYTVFGRVSPTQKRSLVQALQAQGERVGMTGDGVNDILALKQADCAIAIGSGNDASQSVADFVLLDGQFDRLIHVLNEGRRVINNIERVASLYLIKTIYSVLLAVLFMLWGHDYPFHLSQLTPISALTVGIPSFLLALEPDFRPPVGRFMQNVLMIALPASISVTAYAWVLSSLSNYYHWTYLASSSVMAWLIALIAFEVLALLAQPYRAGKVTLLGIILVLVLSLFLGWGGLFAIQLWWQSPLLGPLLLLSLTTLPLMLGLRKTLGNSLMRWYQQHHTS